MRDALLRANGKRAGSRARRMIRHPYSTLLPWLMRKTATTRPVDVDLVWGGTFSGILPEAVSSTIWRFGFFDLNLSLTLLDFLEPGDTFIDVGAHFGYFSLLASHLAGKDGRVFSIEAMPSTFEYLKRNIETNAPFQNVSMTNNAAFDKSTTLEFRDFGLIASSLNSAFGSRGDNSLHDGKGNTVQINARKVDDMLGDAGIDGCKLVKIDAESSEKFVLLGMERTIQRYRPIIITEVGDYGVENGISSSEQIIIMLDHGYKPHKRIDWQLKPFELKGGLVEYANLVFLP